MKKVKGIEKLKCIFVEREKQKILKGKYQKTNTVTKTKWIL